MKKNMILLLGFFCINAQHLSNNSPRRAKLLDAIARDELQLLKILLRDHYNPNLNCGVGTALDFAKLYGKERAAQILQHFGAKSGAELGMVVYGRQ